MQALGPEHWRMALERPAQLRFSFEMMIVRWGVTAIPLDLLMSLDDLVYAVMALY